MNQWFSNTCQLRNFDNASALKSRAAKRLERSLSDDHSGIDVALGRTSAPAWRWRFGRFCLHMARTLTQQCQVFGMG